MQKTKQYRNMKMCVVKMKQLLKNKKHKSITDNRSRIQNDLNQTKNEIKSLQKELSEIIQKHLTIRTKILPISRQLFIK